MVKRTCLLFLVLTCPLSIAISGEPSKITSHIRREPLASTALATAGYSKRLHIMEVEFCNGAIYRYFGVPAAVYRDFQSAESKTRYYDWHIKGQYRSLRLRTSGPQIAQQ